MLKSIKVLVLLLFVANSAQAGTQESTRKVVKLNWENISQQQYIDNLVQCQSAIKELEWSHSLWPKENKKPKPFFIEVYDKTQVRESVMKNLKMQAITSQVFNKKITAEMLQQDLNRMAHNTKDSKKLKQIFKLLDNNPKTIVECVSRDYLVKKIFNSSYYSSKTIHSSLKHQAEIELENYQINGNSDNFSATIGVNVFQLKKDDKSQSSQTNNIIELSNKEYQEVFYKASQESLLDEKFGFLYSKILKNEHNSIEVESIFWKKTNPTIWLQNQDMTYHYISEFDSFSLPIILGENKTFTQKFTGTADTWAIDNLPEARRYHTAVWTGTEMIVWGGIDAATLLDSGSKYNPSTDSWQLTTLSGAPAARSDHTAIWSGTEMIVWGGSGAGGNLNSGGKYNPASDSWVATSQTNVPTARVHHTTIWTGTEMIVWGGIDAGLTNTGARYNPTTNSWTTITTTNVPQARNRHTAIWTGTDMIIWGGDIFSGTLNTGGKYNPVNDTWITTSITNAPDTRYDHTAIWSGTEMIVWGGHFKTSGGRYNPITNSWVATSLTNAPSARLRHVAIWSGSEMIIWSGSNSNTGARYNPSTDSWNPTSQFMPADARESATAIWSGTEMIVWGGFGGSIFLNTGGRYNPTSDTWNHMKINDIPHGIKKPTAVWTGNEMLIWGKDNSGPIGGVYHPTTDCWTAMSMVNSPSGGEDHAAIWTGSEMIVWGGVDSFGNIYNTGGRYNPLANSWVATPSSGAPTARIRHTATWSGSQMIIWGGLEGFSSNSATNTGALYNPTTDFWTAMPTLGTIPTARDRHTSVWTGNEMIVWGGSTNTTEVNRYNPLSNDWTISNPAGSVNNRTGHTAIWTGTEMIIWGGKNGSNYTNGGARYNPVTDSWFAMTITGAPSNRRYHSAIWTGTDMIVWGGETSYNIGTNTGSIYSPTSDSWQSTSLSNAAGSRFNQVAIWSGNQMILWGGTNNSKAINTVGIYTPYTDYSLSGNLFGLMGTEVVLQNNAGDDLILNANGPFTFNGTINGGSSYNVTVLTQPTNPSQTCTITNASGTNVSSNITDVTVTCVDDTFLIGGMVTGLLPGNPNTLILQNNNSDDLLIHQDGAFVFATPLLDLQAYSISILSQPNSPAQMCSIVAGSGNVAGDDVDTIEIICPMGTELIFSQGFE